jgi:ParB family chromosome partitioning protein
LANSIKEQGIVQPLVVREREGKYELIAGERRWRAAQLVGLKEVPVIIREADDRAVLELALIENLQRENLNPLEEAQGYQQLAEQFQLTQEDIALKVGKSRAVVANALRLLKLPLPVQNHLRDGQLTVGHAKVLLGLSGEKPQTLAADRIIKEGLSVRQTEALVAKLQSTPLSSSRPPAVRDVHVAHLENKLREKLGTKIALRYHAGKGALEIQFFSDAELERLLGVLGIDPA